MTDHRLKTNYELTSFLGGDIENAVQVWFPQHPLLRHALFLVSVIIGMDLYAGFVTIRLPLPTFLQACTSLEQQELLEELAESVGAPAG